ncbi:Putative L,D-transpeptidase YkuD [Nitratireductor thuwali]|uniref:L,D-transpeptidase YkuD n=2 Tax=Nitratireductor thuwali TaxID=2267699 RepID=A0ABY5MIQ8_9HYPH|nr:Putative L,D-transpeptidase YkuD [Nitratireductor thuwali]
MTRYLVPFFSGLAMASQAGAVPFTDSRANAPAVLPQAQVQLAQAYDFDVYIDQYGREVVVDPRTGRVVEIRPPVMQRPALQPPPAARRAARDRELGRRSYDLTDPRDLERLRRDREAIIAREPPPYGGPRYSDPGYRDRGLDDYGYEREPGYDDFDGFADEPGQWGDDGDVRREPLAPPGSGRDDYAAVPQDETGLPPTGGDDLRPALPGDERAVTVPGARGASEDVAQFQVLLDRAGASPGVIDGRTGDNVNKAISAYREITGQRLRTYDKEWIEAELERTGGPAFVDYTITAADAAGPYIASVPEDYGEKARLERLGFTRVSEMLAERFHMDEKYLVALNPDADFSRPGTRIKVVNPGETADAKVARIVADKAAKQVRAYDERGRLVGAYPATIGSADTPSPIGTHEVARIAFDPEYTYNPKVNFKQGENDKVLTIPPGPNGPVGSIWIALSKPTYGIHGTPEPSKIGKTSSHGCVRLTNWDAQELAKRIKPGVTVEFAE